MLAHPDDESLGFGGTLAKYAAEGVEVFAADRHARRRRTLPRPPARASAEHPGPRRWPSIREAELRAAAAVLGVREVSLLDYHDQQLDRAEPARGDRAASPRHLRRSVRTSSSRSGPTARTGIPITSRSRSSPPRRSSPRPTRRSLHGRGRGGAPPHAVSKLYYLAWPASTWAAFRRRSGRLIVDGRRRRAAGDAVAGLGDHHRDRHARVSGPRSGGRSRATSRRCRLRAAEAICRRSTTRRCGAGSRSIACSAPSTADARARPTSSKESADDPPARAARDGRRDVSRARASPRGSARGPARVAAARSGDPRRVAVGGARGARPHRPAAGGGHGSRRRCSSRRRGCCSITRCSTAIRASSATSPRRRRRSACSATSWPRR